MYNYTLYQKFENSCKKAKSSPLPVMTPLRLLRRYTPQNAVICSTLWERAAGSPPNTSQVSLNHLFRSMFRFYRLLSGRVDPASSTSIKPYVSKAALWVHGCFETPGRLFASARLTALSSCVYSGTLTLDQKMLWRLLSKLKLPYLHLIWNQISHTARSTRCVRCGTTNWKPDHTNTWNWTCLLCQALVTCNPCLPEWHANPLAT